MARRSSIVRPCRLCLEPKPLCRSHIIPEFMYSSLYSTNRMIAYIEEYGRMRRRVVQVGHRERLLCADCEDRINKNYESPNVGLWRALVEGQPPPPSISIVPLPYAPATLVSGFDYASVKLLLLSIFWRASVAGRQNYLVNLGEHENAVRLMLLKAEPRPHTAYPCLVYLFGDPITRKLIRRPVGTKLDGWPSYQLLLPGAVLWFVVSRSTASYSLAPREDGSMYVGRLQSSDVPLVQQTITTLRAIARS